MTHRPYGDLITSINHTLTHTGPTGPTGATGPIGSNCYLGIEATIVAR